MVDGITDSDQVKGNQYLQSNKIREALQSSLVTVKEISGIIG